MVVREPESCETGIGNVAQPGPKDFGQGGQGNRPVGKFLESRQIRVREIVEDLPLDLLIQRRDIRDATRDGVYRASNRDVQGKGPRFHVGSIGVAPHGQGIPASQQGLGRLRNVLRGRIIRLREFDPEVLSFAKPYRCNVPGFGALTEFPP